MTKTAHCSRGIELNGIIDTAATCQSGSMPHLEVPPIPKPACVMAPALPGERPIGGDLAYDSLDGRGWDPTHQRTRRPVLQLLHELDSTSTPSKDIEGSAIGDLLAAHLGALSQESRGKQVVAVPDTLNELGQQRLLDGLRRSNIAAELIWRPVATVLGWSCRQSSSFIEGMDRKTVLIVHAGFWRPEASLLELEIETHQDQRMAIPIRRGKGIGLWKETAWPIQQLALDCVLEDLEKSAATGLSAEDLTWTSRRPWSILCNETAPDEIIRDAKGIWHRLKGSPPLASQRFTETATALRGLLAPILETALNIDRVLIDGPLLTLSAGSDSLGKMLKKELLRHISSLSSQAVEIIPTSWGLTACGAAHYGWRRRQGIPGYYDSIPDLRINACIENPHGPAFVSLMQGKERVVGGQPIGPLEARGFSIAAHAEAVNYYLTRADEPTVRETRTKLPQPPSEDTPVDLVVTQTPGQGFASVEIRPPRNKQLGYSPVFLDWSSMQDTGKTPDTILSELQKECGLAYPEISPFPCHATVWENVDIVRCMQRFLAAARQQTGGSKDASKSLMSTLSRKLSLDFLLHRESSNANKAGIIDSNGGIPTESQLRSQLGPPPLGYESYQSLVDEVREQVDAWFEKLMHTRVKGKDLKDLHRRLLLIGGWFYSSAPPQILSYTRNAFTTGNSLFDRYDFNVAGRCFSSHEDIKRLFARVYEDFRSSQKARNSPFDRIKALSLVLSYRSDAPLALTSGQANRFANFAAKLMQREQQQCNIAQKFFKAAHLLMGLLRYRRVDSAFLDPAQRDNAELVGLVIATLQDAQKCVSGDKATQVKAILEQMTEFIEKRGTNALIFSELDSLSD